MTVIRGVWHVHKGMYQIPTLAPLAHMSGIASFVRFQADNRLLFREHGALKGSNFPPEGHEAHRQYLYVAEDNFPVFVYFVEPLGLGTRPHINPQTTPEESLFRIGEEFFRIDEGSIVDRGRYRFAHVCGKDLYAGALHIVDSNEFHLYWTVRGPNKSMCIQSVFARADPPNYDKPVGPEICRHCVATAPTVAAAY